MVITMANIVIAEDEERVRTSLVRALTAQRHSVTAVSSGLAAIEAALLRDTDVLVLDLGLPDLDGTQALRMIRAVSQVPVIVATARDDDSEVVRVLDSGADDYVIKPFSSSHLEARIRAVLRRAGGEAGREVPELRVGELTIDRGRRRATLEGRPLELSRIEFDLLAYLAAREGAVVGKRQLLAEVWGQPYGGADKTVDVHLSWLRRKLGETAAAPRYVHTVRGVGVRLAPPGE